MKIDKTTTVSGGGILTSDVDTEDLILFLDPAPALLAAVVLPTTVSITHLFLDSFDPGTPVDPDPEPDETQFYGVPSAYLGFGGAVGGVYNTCYPLSGLKDDEFGGTILWQI